MGSVPCRVAVVVVSYRTHVLLEDHLAALASQAPEAEVVVVDCWSGPGERAAVRALVDRHGWHGVYPATNLGFGGGANAGAAAAIAGGAEAVLLLNPDARLDGPGLRRLTAAVVREPMTMVAPRILRPDGRVWFDGSDLDLRDGSVRATRRRPAGTRREDVMEWLTGACLMVSAELWQAVGGFAEDYFMYWEDVDLTRRVLDAGGSVRVEREVTAVHDPGGSQDAVHGGKSALYYHYNARNRLLFAARHLDDAGRRRWRRASLRQGWELLRRGGRRHLLARGTPVPIVVAATREGLRLSRRTRRSRRTPGRRGAGPGGLTVLLSVPPPRPTTNPYVVMLADAVGAVPGVAVRHFSWRAALLGRYDVFHVHWPELLVQGSTSARALARQLATCVLLARLVGTRTPLVRTVHNVEAHERPGRRQMLVLALLERVTTLRIRINTGTPAPPGQPGEVVLHGDYGEWFARFPHSAAVPGRAVCFGALRPYKAVPELVDAFRGVSDPTLTLRVAGRPASEGLAAAVLAAADGDPRVSLSFGFLTEAEVAAEVTAAELVVLAYPGMHNSGAVLAALSLGRRVLVPANDVTSALADEVGPGWVLTYDGEVSAAAIEDAFARLRVTPPAGPPDLSRRRWRDAGPAHVRAYERAVGLRRGLPPAPARGR